MQQTVMIADDSIPVHVLMKKQLEHEPLKFHSVYDGLSALSAAETLQPDLILMDVDMPRADGFQACQSLKANPLTSGIPLIFISGDALTDDKVRGLELGAIDYIVKPFKPDELRARIRSALRRKPELPDGQMAGGLGGIWTRPYFFPHLHSQLARAKRYERPLSCVVVDLELRTKLAGGNEQSQKEVLRTISRAFVLRCRAEDTLFQFDAGRYVLLMGDTARGEASKMTERLCADVEEQLTAAQANGIEVTYSVGIADTQIATDATLLERACIASERARRRGGNCTAVARIGRSGRMAA